jgi:hypothetical protein
VSVSVSVSSRQRAPAEPTCAHGRGGAFVVAVLPEIYLCDVGSCQEILRVVHPRLLPHTLGY